MKLSVVIVNYNVRHFLDQCLQSVYKSIGSMDAEVFVVDNHSVDGSIEMIQEFYPQVKLIANKDNVGFSKANNQAILASKGEYVLLLNPDTVVEEDTFIKCVDFMDSHEDAGAMGVKLIDGKGKFLPESKRGLPTPKVAFYKISGISRLFPRSSQFGKYHMGHLPENETNSIEVLSGAFMFIRRKALDQAGLLDEDFFMYGEDIDLSYRITKIGYRIYYHPQTRVIHYRGESTKKSSVNYVFVFYQAMIIFANKHFMPNQAKLYGLIIRFAVYLRASLSVIHRLVLKLWLPVVEVIVFFTGMLFLKDYWAAKSGVYYPYEFIRVAMPLYIASWVGASWISGAYDRPLRLIRSLRGIVGGTILILLVYALLDEQFRYSRFLTLMGAAWAAVSATSLRIIVNILKYHSLFPETVEMKRILVVGEKTEADRVTALLNQSPIKTSYLGIVNPGNTQSNQAHYNGELKDLKEMVEIFRINEIIFCGKDLTSAQIMDQMMHINHPELEYKIAPPESLYIIGSNSIQSNGDIYTVGLNAVDKQSNRRKKRLFDIGSSLVLLVLYPVACFIIKDPMGLLKNILTVLIGRYTWVGYAPSAREKSLPYVKPGVLHPMDPFSSKSQDQTFLLQANILYAKDYRLQHDLAIMLPAFKALGRKIK